MQHLQGDANFGDHSFIAAEATPYSVVKDNDDSQRTGHIAHGGQNPANFAGRAPHLQGDNVLRSVRNLLNFPSESLNLDSLRARAHDADVAMNGDEDQSYPPWGDPRALTDVIDTMPLASLSSLLRNFSLTSAVHAAADDGSRTEQNLATLTPVVKYIRRIKFESPALQQLSKLCGVRSVEPDDIFFGVTTFRGWRSVSLNEAGVRMIYEAGIQYLRDHATKQDLEIVAWALGLPRTGPKTNVMNSVMVLLIDPVKTNWNIGRKAPVGVLANESAWANSAAAAAPVVAPTAEATANSRPSLSDQQRSPPVTRASQPSEVDRGVERSGRLMTTRSSSRQPHSPRSSTSAQGSGRSMPSLSRRRSPATKRKHTARLLPHVSPASNGYAPTGFGAMVDHAIARFPFSKPESPFFVTYSTPLGQPAFTTFNMAQLDKSEVDTALSFATPDLSRVPLHDRQVHLRCLKVNLHVNPSDWEHCWPFPAYARVNSTVVTLNQAQRYTNGKLAGRDGATDITIYLRAPRAATDAPLNRVRLKRHPSNDILTPDVYLLFAQEVLVKSNEKVMEEVREQSRRFYEQLHAHPGVAVQHSDAEAERMFITERMNSEGVVIDFVQVSMRCPLSFKLIETPAKGVVCDHVQCFDLTSYIEYARKTFKYECPVCNKRTATPDQLHISAFFADIMARFPSETHLEVHANGSVCPRQRARGDGTPAAGNTAFSGGAGGGGLHSARGGGAVDGARGGAGAQHSGGVLAKSESMPLANGHALTPTQAPADDVVDLTMDSDNDDGKAAAGSPPAAQSGTATDKSMEEDDDEDDHVLRRRRGPQPSAETLARSRHGAPPASSSPPASAPPTTSLSAGSLVRFPAEVQQAGACGDWMREPPSAQNFLDEIIMGSAAAGGGDRDMAAVLGSGDADGGDQHNIVVLSD